jgi:hypothetical protein
MRQISVRRLLALSLAVCASSAAQQRPPSLTGTVISARDGTPVKRAEVILRSVVPGVNPQGVTSDQNGRFSFYEVKPGSYSLYALHDGFLPSTYVLYRGARMPRPFTLAESQPLNDLQLRLPSAGTLSGKVQHSEGDSASSVIVEAYRSYYERGRHLYEIAGRAITNDRGEYRIYNLPPGTYYLSASFKTFRGADNIQENLPTDTTGTRLPPERSVNTFFPSAWKLSDAATFTLGGGVELPNMDITLARTRPAIVRGRMISALSGRAVQGATISLHWTGSPQSGGLPARIETKPLEDGTFELWGVAPGTYYIDARGSEQQKPLRVREVLVVTESPEEKVELLLRQEAVVNGIVRVDNKSEIKMANVKLTFEPRIEAPSKTVSVNSKGEFDVSLLPGVDYNITLASAPNNVYLTGAHLNSADVLTNGLMLVQSPTVPLEVTLGTAAAELIGVSQPGANVLLMPEDGRLEKYQSTTASQYGFFEFHGISPGGYRVLSWFDTPPCEVHDPDNRALCNAFGKKVTLAESASQTLEVEPSDKLEARATSSQ